MNSEVQTLLCPQRDLLEEKLCACIAEHLRAACEQRGTATLALSGGATPRELYRRLADIALPWQRIHARLVDDRCVPQDHPDSNEAMVRANLLRGPATQAQFRGLIERNDQHVKPVDDLELPEESGGGFDLVVLGMGTDGHTASWFPDSPDLSQALHEHQKPVVHVRTPGGEHDRVTLTRAAVLNSRLLVLYINGREKKRALARVLEDGAVEEYPVRAVLRQEDVPVKVYWAP